MTNSIRLGSRIICADSQPYVIAEIGVNHEGSMELAKKLIDLAVEGGADAVKFQSYKADSLASKNSPSYWNTDKEPTRSQHELFQKYDKFDAAEFIELAEYCKVIGVEFSSTPFDDASIEFLDPLVSFFKIASADLTNLPFLRKIAGKGKPVILSTGASTLAEIDLAVDTLEKAGCRDTALLHCILNYPTENCNAHIRMIEGIKRAYPDRIVGYSDHTLPDESMTALVSAHLLGAVILEKHFSHDKSLPGNDHYHAMDVNDLKRFVEMYQRINSLLGPTSLKAPIETEEISRLNARRSVVTANDLPTGKVLMSSDITYKRPGTGISPIHWDELIGRTVSHPLPADHVLQWEDLI